MATEGPQQARHLPDSSVTASLHLQGAQQAQVQPRDTTAGRLCRSPARLGPLSQGKGREELTEEGLNSSLQETWCLGILSLAGDMPKQDEPEA